MDKRYYVMKYTSQSGSICKWMPGGTWGGGACKTGGVSNVHINRIWIFFFDDGSLCASTPLFLKGSEQIGVI